MKKILAVILAVILATSMLVIAAPVESIRSAAERYNATVSWDGENQRVVITLADGSTSHLSVGQHGSFNENGTIYAPEDYITAIFTPSAVEEVAEEAEAADTEETAEETPAVLDAPPITLAPAQPAYTPPTTDEAVEETVATSGIHGHLHRVEHANGSVAYIFGSLHGGTPEWFPLADIVEDAMARSDVFAFETDFSISAEEMSDIMEELLTLPDGQTIDEVLPQELYERYLYFMDSWAAAFGQELLEDLYTTNPSALIFILSNALVNAFSDIDLQGGGDGITVDGYVFNFAVEAGLPTLGLMDTMEQNRLILAPPTEIMHFNVENFGTLEDVMDAMSTDVSMLDDMVASYLSNDYQWLNRIMHGDGSIANETIYDTFMRESILNDRSTLFANEIIRLLEASEAPTTFFITVGKSHLIRHHIGPDFTSILEQLALQGFEAVAQF